MKTKLIVVGTLMIVMIGGVIVLLKNLRKKVPETMKEVENKVEPPKTEDIQPKPNYENPERLLQCILENLIQENIYKNERDFQERLTKLFIERAKSIEWMEYCPVSLDEMQEWLGKFGLLGRFEEELEQKYESRKR